MTVTYTAQVATCRGLGCFLKLLKRWKGSIYKLVWLDLFLFLTIFYSLNTIHRYALDDEQKKVFVDIVQYCKDYSDLIPLSFVLGFYVSIVMTRWWNQYITIPFPDSIAVFVSATIHGQDERGRVMRRSIMRYVCLCITMMFTMISPRVKMRFPTLDHFIEAGLLQVSEKEIMSDLNVKFPKYSKHWMPIVWATSIITRARKEGRIRDDFAVKTIIDELNKLRGQCGLLLSYDTISVPLVYTQVVTLAVYTYFITSLMGHQYVEGGSYKFDLYFPVFTTLQFFFYMGWLKVAESLINPFGDDDDDFEVNWMIDRNLQVSYLIVDEMHHAHPELVRDQYWDEVFPQELPYTLASEPFRESHPLPSTANIAVMPSAMEVVMPPSSVKVDDMQSTADMNSAITFTARPSSAYLKRGISQTSTLGTSVPDSISRVNSVTNILKKIFTREDSRDSRIDKESPIELIPTMVAPQMQTHTTKMTNFGSSTSLSTQARTQPNTMRIADQIIEEVDEQLTITSQKNANDTRPSVMTIFGPPPPSEPISVPHSQNGSKFVKNNEFSRSAPLESQASPNDIMDNLSLGSVTDESDSDDFEKLKTKRQQEMRSRLVLNLTRSQSGGETEFLLKNKASLSESNAISRDRLNSERSSVPDDADVFGYNKYSPLDSTSDGTKKFQ